MSELTSLYKGIIQSLGLTVNDKGGVYIYGLEEDEPYNVDGKHLVVPYDNVLRNPDWEHQIAFHPLSENIARKDSVVLKTLQSLGNISIDADIGLIISELISYCADSDRHGKLNAKQTAFLSLYPNADETSLKNWMKIEAKIGKDHHYARLLTYRDRKLNGESYSRVTYVTFPLYNELCKLIDAKAGDYTVYGVKLRKKDAEGIKALFEYIFKSVDNPDAEYSTGTRSLVAPSFHAFINSFYKVKKELEKVFKLLKMDTESLAWGNEVADLTKFKGLIPPLAGNEGELTEGERRRNEQQVGVAPQQPQSPKVTPKTVSQVHQALLQNSNNKVLTPTAPAPKPQAPVQHETVKTGGLVKREIPIKTDVNFNTLPPQTAMMPMMQQPPMVNGRMVDHNGRPIPVPNYGQAQVVGYTTQPQALAQPQPQQLPVQQMYQQPVYQQPVMMAQPMVPVQQPVYGQPMMVQQSMQPVYQQPMMPVQTVQPRNQVGMYPYGR